MSACEFCRTLCLRPCTAATPHVCILSPITTVTMSEGTKKNAFSSKVPACVEETCYESEGRIMSNFMPRRVIDQLREFNVRPDDLFIVTYPKSGTTWMIQIATLIRVGGDATKLEGKSVVGLVPFLDIVTDFKDPVNSPTKIEMAETMPSPRIMKSHFPSPWLPKDIRTDDPKVKVIYVVRNPKDTAVSYYHFCHYVGPMPSYESWDVFFEEYLAGRTPGGSWFENVLPWWQRRNHPNVLFLKYEDMKKDLPAAVRQISDFMGNPLSDDAIASIAKASTFGAMKENKSSNPDFILKDGAQKGNRSFMRKGVVGDWKNYFTEDQNKRFDALYEKEMAGTGLVLDFE